MMIDIWVVRRLSRKPGKRLDETLHIILFCWCGCVAVDIEVFGLQISMCITEYIRYPSLYITLNHQKIAKKEMTELLVKGVE